MSAPLQMVVTVTTTDRQELVWDKLQPLAIDKLVAALRENVSDWEAIDIKITNPRSRAVMRPQIFVDLDGVMADFDAAYEREFGERPDKQKDNVDWDKVLSRPGFYRNLQLLPDAMELWRFACSLRKLPPPVILTGCPKKVPSAGEEKREMVREKLGAGVQVITCASRDKATFAKPGDILIDDWEKYRHIWEAMGGRWITHTSAASSIEQLKAMLQRDWQFARL